MVTFCWIAINDEERLPAWIDNALFSRLKLHNDLEQHFKLDPPILTPDQVKEAEECERLPELAQRAIEVDRYWSERLPGDFRPDTPRHLLSIRGLYAGIYRIASRAVHVEPQTIDPYMKDDLQSYPNTILIPNEPHTFWCEAAGPLFGMATLVHHELFGWPDAKRIRTLMTEAYPDAGSET